MEKKRLMIGEGLITCHTGNDEFLSERIIPAKEVFEWYTNLDNYHIVEEVGTSIIVEED